MTIRFATDITSAFTSHHHTLHSAVLEATFATETGCVTVHDTSTLHHTETVTNLQKLETTEIRTEFVTQYVTTTERVTPTEIQTVRDYVTFTVETDHYITITKDCYNPIKGNLIYFTIVL
ncbi:uncharacterized protein LOC122242866 [Penaeus japonicus]|uniref:uncharacterized protein LOC122242866 n=1 Tax=Penaeus japonicus TaxID=27405 RepID=UPI001C716ABF|nr:uncharacterized protein LOC122242866 [Penaeus japonicus]